MANDKNARKLFFVLGKLLLLYYYRLANYTKKMSTVQIVDGLWKNDLISKKGKKNLSPKLTWKIYNYFFFFVKFEVTALRALNHKNVFRWENKREKTSDDNDCSVRSVVKTLSEPFETETSAFIWIATPYSHYAISSFRQYTRYTFVILYLFACSRSCSCSC